jgi:hypothetical protein
MSQDPTSGDEPPLMTNMQEAGVMMHELFITLQGAGFTHEEAFHLVSNLLNTMMAEGFRQASSGG